MSHDNEIKVWDPVVRFFHWTLVVAFFTAYFIADDPPMSKERPGCVLEITHS